MGLFCYFSIVVFKIKRILKGLWSGVIKMEIIGMGWRIKKGIEMFKVKVDFLIYLLEFFLVFEFKVYVEELKCEVLLILFIVFIICIFFDVFI